MIRDLPEAANIEKMLSKGYITIEDALTAIADAIREERNNEIIRKDLEK